MGCDVSTICSRENYVRIMKFDSVAKVCFSWLWPATFLGTTRAIGNEVTLYRGRVGKDGSDQRCSTPKVGYRSHNAHSLETAAFNANSWFGFKFRFVNLYGIMGGHIGPSTWRRRAEVQNVSFIQSYIYIIEQRRFGWELQSHATSVKTFGRHCTWDEKSVNNRETAMLLQPQ